AAETGLDGRALPNLRPETRRKPRLCRPSAAANRPCASMPGHRPKGPVSPRAMSVTTANKPRRLKAKANPKVGIVSLGCPKALVDSERILTTLRSEGYEISDSYDGADVVIVNTCGFLNSARQESLDAIGE